MKRTHLSIAIWLLGTFLLNHHASGQAVQAMKLLTPQVGWAWSGQHLYWTLDAGAQWKGISPAVSSGETLAGVFFLDTSTGWVVLSHTDDQDQVQFRVASTHDAGSTWSVSPIQLPWKRYAEDFGGEPMSSSSINSTGGWTWV